jgi:transcriptional regulator GlxA family with amidase domain
LAVEGLVLEWIAWLARAGARREHAIPEWLRAARDLLAQSVERGRDIAGVASEVGVTPSTLARAFRRAYGRRPAEFARDLRLRRAVALVSAGTKSLAQIAAETGFADESHLIRCFRRHTGLTPGQFRTQQTRSARPV